MGELSPQIGVGCAFYANVPALTKVSGIQIVDGTEASRGFVASIYGLPTPAPAKTMARTSVALAAL